MSSSPASPKAGAKASASAPIRRRAVGYVRNFGPALLIVAMLVAGFLAPLPYSPTEPDAAAITLSPSAQHWFGTDLSGFDVFARVIASAKYVLPLVIAGTVLSLLVGVPVGLLASSRIRGAETLVRVVDAFQAFPLLVLSVTLVILTGNHLSSVIIAIALVNVPRFIRLVRSEGLVIRNSRYIEAAAVVGCSRIRVLWRHILPNTADSIMAQASLAAANGVIIIASLNFLGIGVSQPNPTWGSMLQDGAQTVSQGYWWMFAFPGVAVLVTVLAFNGVSGSIARRFGGER